jgi:hypothetical protein
VRVLKEEEGGRKRGGGGREEGEEIHKGIPHGISNTAPFIPNKVLLWISDICRYIFYFPFSLCTYRKT